MKILNKIWMNLTTVAILTLTIVMFVLGCTGNNYLGNDEKVAVKGQVADGYLRHATVFFDCNDNQILETNEKATESGESGKYTLNVSSSIAENCKLVVVATNINKVKDEDDTHTDGRYKTLAEAGRSGFILSAPKGKTKFISPLTTIADIYTKNEKRGVLASLGLNTEEDFYNNYMIDLETKSKARILTYLFSYHKISDNKNLKDIVNNTMSDFTNIYFTNSHETLYGTNADKKIEEIKRKIKEQLTGHSGKRANSIATLRTCEQNVNDGGNPISIGTLNQQRDILDPLETGEESIHDNTLANGYYAFLMGDGGFTRLALYQDGDRKIMIGNTLYPIRLVEAESDELYEKKTIKTVYTSFTGEVNKNYSEVIAVKCADGVYAYKLTHPNSSAVAYVTDKTRNLPAAVYQCSRELSVTNLPVNITLLNHPDRDIANTNDTPIYADNMLIEGGYYAFLKEGGFTKLALYQDGDPTDFIGGAITPVRLSEAESDQLYEKKTIKTVYTSYTGEVNKAYSEIVAVKCSDGAYVYKLDPLYGGYIAYVTDKTR